MGEHRPPISFPPCPGGSLTSASDQLPPPNPPYDLRFLYPISLRWVVDYSLGFDSFLLWHRSQDLPLRLACMPERASGMSASPSFLSEECAQSVCLCNSASFLSSGNRFPPSSFVFFTDSLFFVPSGGSSSAKDLFDKPLFVWRRVLSVTLILPFVRLQPSPNLRIHPQVSFPDIPMFWGPPLLLCLPPRSSTIPHGDFSGNILSLRHPITFVVVYDLSVRAPLSHSSL